MSQQAVEPRGWQKIPIADVLLVLGAIVLAIGFVTALAGCQTEASGRLHRTIELKWDGDGRPLYREETGNQTRAVAPGATSQPTSATVTSNGASSSASGRQPSPVLPDFVYGLAQRQWIFYGGAALCGLGAVIAAWRAQVQLAIYLGILAAALLLAPTFIDQYAILVVGAVVLCGGAWLVSRFVHRGKADKAAMRDAYLRSMLAGDTATALTLESAPTISKMRHRGKVPASVIIPSRSNAASTTESATLRG